jgi:hypothetical protein
MTHEEDEQFEFCLRQFQRFTGEGHPMLIGEGF